MKLSLVTPCRNEEASISNCYEAVRDFMKESLPEVEYEHVFIDNMSDDSTRDILDQIASNDSHVKLVFHSRNYGVHESFIRGIRAIDCDGLIPILADLQTPVEVVGDFYEASDHVTRSVIGLRQETKTNRPRLALNAAYYSLMSRLGSPKIPRNFMGFGLYVGPELAAIQNTNDPQPFLRGLVLSRSEDLVAVEYEESRREYGKSSSGVLRDYDFLYFSVVRHSNLGRLLSQVLLMQIMVVPIISVFFWMSALESNVIALLIAAITTLSIASVLLSVYFILGFCMFAVGRMRRADGG